MSLKTFHLAFIGCSVLLALGVGLWLLVSPSGAVWGLVSLASGAGLVVYELRFLRKFKHVRYL